MYDKDFAELVKIAAEKLKEDTVYKMLTRSEDYQKESDERDKAERNYEQLDLTMEQRKVCDVFLDYRDRQSLEYSDYSYLAGLYDAFRIMAVIFPDRWDMEQIQKALYSKTSSILYCLNLTRIYLPNSSCKAFKISYKTPILVHENVS